MDLERLLIPVLDGIAGVQAIGLDLVEVAAIARSQGDFGVRFVQRLFTAQEAASTLEARAECFAAKEAAIKAYGWSEASIDWREIEVQREPGGRARLRLHGRAAALASAAGGGEPLLALGHEGPLAGAAVVVPRR